MRTLTCSSMLAIGSVAVGGFLQLQGLDIVEPGLGESLGSLLGAGFGSSKACTVGEADACTDDGGDDDPTRAVGRGSSAAQDSGMSRYFFCEEATANLAGMR